MNFLDLKELFENKLKGIYKYELLELHYTPFSFGSGMTAYKIKGRNIKILFDGKDNEVQLLVSLPHVKYSNVSWATIFSGTPTDLIENLLTKLESLF